MIDLPGERREYKASEVSLEEQLSQVWPDRRRILPFWRVWQWKTIRTNPCNSTDQYMLIKAGFYEKGLGINYGVIGFS